MAHKDTRDDDAFLATLSLRIPLAELGEDLKADQTITPEALQRARQKREGAQNPSAVDKEPLQPDAIAKSGALSTHPKPSATVPPITPSLPTFVLAGELPETTEQQPDESNKVDLEIRERLGEGGMGLVHEALQCSLQRVVAIKTLKPELQGAREKRSLLREARLLSQLEHPNIVPIYTLGQTTSKMPMVVMKRIAGVSWRELIRDASHPYWKQLSTTEEPLDFHLGILLQVCNAVSYAHSHGVLHLDIKPDNVMLGAYGEVYLLDWGVAKYMHEVPEQTREDVFGTPAYMAPEMVLPTGHSLDQRTDVYLLGATLHEIVLGYPRHPGSTVSKAILSVRLSLPVEPHPHMPEELFAIINRATSADTDERYQSVQAFREAIARFLQHRNANRLSRTAEEHQNAFLALLEEYKSAPTDEALEVRIRDAFHACHLTYQLALQAWSQSERAQRGLQACLKHMIEHAIAREDLSTASHWHAQLTIPSESIAQAIATLRTKQAREHSEVKAAQQLQEQLDFRTGNRQRFLFFGSLSGVALLACFLIFRLIPTSDQLTVNTMILMPLGLLSVYGPALFVWRRRLLQRIIDRRLMFFIMLLLFAMLCNRVLGALLHTSVHAVFVQELLILSLLCGLGSLTISTWLWICSVGYLAAACLGVLGPDVARVGFAVANISALFFLIALFRRAS